MAQTDTNEAGELRRLLIEFDHRGKLSDEEHLKAFQKVEAFVQADKEKATIAELESLLPDADISTSHIIEERLSQLKEGKD